MHSFVVIENGNFFCGIAIWRVLWILGVGRTQGSSRPTTFDAPRSVRFLSVVDPARAHRETTKARSVVTLLITYVVFVRGVVLVGNGDIWVE